MEVRYKRRYLILVYLAVLLISLVLAILGIYLLFSPVGTILHTVGTILLNLFTELCGAVVLFFIVKVLFLVGEWNIEELENLKEVLQKIRRVGAEDFFVESFRNEELQKYVQNSRAIDMCGQTLNVTLVTVLPQLREMLSQGGSVRIIIVEPSRESLNYAAIMRSGSMDDRELFVEHYRAKLCSSIKILEDLRQKFGEKVQVRFLPYLPSYGMIKFDFLETFFSEDSFHAVGIYSYSRMKDFDRTPYFLIYRKEKYWFLYFEKQFESLWNISKEWSTIEEARKVIC